MPFGSLIVFVFRFFISLFGFGKEFRAIDRYEQSLPPKKPRKKSMKAILERLRKSPNL